MNRLDEYSEYATGVLLWHMGRSTQKPLSSAIPDGVRQELETLVDVVAKAASNARESLLRDDGSAALSLAHLSIL